MAKDSPKNVAARMRAAAGKFIAAAEVEGTERVIAATLLKVARDYKIAAAYIDELEDKLAKYQLQAIRNAGRAA